MDVHAVTGFVRLIGAGPAPAVLILDDMRWAGPETADLPCHLVRRAGAALRVAIVVRIGDLAMTNRLPDAWRTWSDRAGRATTVYRR